MFLPTQGVMEAPGNSHASPPLWSSWAACHTRSFVSTADDGRLSFVNKPQRMSWVMYLVDRKCSRTMSRNSSWTLQGPQHPPRPNSSCQEGSPESLSRHATLSVAGQGRPSGQMSLVCGQPGKDSKQAGQLEGAGGFLQPPQTFVRRTSTSSTRIEEIAKSRREQSDNAAH